MFFRNLFLFRFDVAALGIAAERLEQTLAEKRLREVGQIELASVGFVSPFGRNEVALVHAVGDFALITLGGQERLLPSDVVKDELASRIADLQAKTGRRPGGRERKRIKEEVVTDLLPRAFVRESRLNAYFDLARGWLVINTATRRAAESVVTSIRDALGSFPCVPMAPEESPRALMTDWLARGKLPAGLTLGDECELRDPVEAGAIVRCKHQELETDEVREHLKSGKQVYRTALCFNDRLTLVLSEDLTIRQLRFLDVVQDELGDDSKESAAAELDAVFALQTLELRVLLDWLETTFKVHTAPAHKLDGGDASPEMREAERAVVRQAARKLDALARADGASFTLSGPSGEVLLRGGKPDEAEDEPRDVLFDNAVKIVREADRAGISHLQRKLAIGYNRAARLIESMERQGIVSPPDRAGNRTVIH